MLGGDGVDDGAGLVGGAVVDGDDLEVGVVLSEKGVERGGDVGGFVAGGDDDGEGWRPAGERSYCGSARFGMREGRGLRSRLSRAKPARSARRRRIVGDGSNVTVQL